MRVLRYTPVIVVFIMVIIGIWFRGAVHAFVSTKILKLQLPEPISVREVNVRNPSSLPSLPPTPPNLPSERGGNPRATATAEQAGEELPLEFNLTVPFTAQAPYRNWDHVHGEACEEASVAMVDAFFRGRHFSQASAEKEILENVAWETKNIGHWEDTTAEETARILREKYGYANVRVVYDPTLEMVKGEIVLGHPVIIPAAGQLLHNPYFRGAGPLYHMIVVRGWTKDGKIITNDPGTKRGEEYLYRPEVLINAMHDWNSGDVLQGRKVVIVVEK